MCKALGDLKKMPLSETGGSALAETVKSWTKVAKRFSLSFVQDRVTNLRRKWVTELPTGDTACDEMKRALVDISEEAAEVVAMCAHCDNRVEALSVQHGGAVHACIGELIRGRQLHCGQRRGREQIGRRCERGVGRS